MRRGARKPALIAPLAAVLLLLAVAPAAVAGVVLPERGGSPNADDITTLYSVTLYIATVIFVGVEGALIWALIRYRRRRGAPAPAQIRGNTPLEIGWTLGAGLIVVVLAIMTFVYLDDIRNPPRSGPNGLSADAGVELAAVDQPAPPGGDALEIEVNGQQYIWRYDYPGDEPLFSYHEMVVPTDTTVVLKLTSQDVVHAWWIPKLGGKMDAMPGHVNKTWFKISEPGVYDGQCTELCGDGHADMLAEVRAVSPPEFERWARERRQGIQDARDALATQRRFRERQSGGDSQ